MDTNILVDAARDYYRFRFETRFWSWLLDARRQGQITSIQQVRSEIHEVNPEFQQWLTTAAAQSFFLAPEAEWVPRYSEVISYVETTYLPGKPRDDFANGADGWLLAAAIARGDGILTFEKPAPDSQTKPKIPTVALHFGVPCSDPWQVYEDFNARF